MIIDTHCHLDDMRYAEDIDEVLLRAKQHGVERFIIPGADLATLERAVLLSETYEEVYFAVGVHPCDAHCFDMSKMEKFVMHPKCVAVGECGLDYFRLPENIEEKEAEIELQKEIFITQILWAKALKKPLIVHVRDASNDALEILEHYAGDEGGVLHCFNADEVLLKLAKRNFYYGIGGVLTFKNGRKLVNVFPKIPHDRLLIETDAPYLTPHPHRGERNEPSYTTLVAKKMAELSDIPIQEVASLSSNNAQRLFHF